MYADRGACVSSCGEGRTNIDGTCQDCDGPCPRSTSSRIVFPRWRHYDDDDDAQICIERVLSVPVKQDVGLEMSSERRRRERCGSKGSWQTVPDVWAGDRKTPRSQCCRRPWHEQCPGVSRSEMSLAGDSRNRMAVIDYVPRHMRPVFTWPTRT